MTQNNLVIKAGKRAYEVLKHQPLSSKIVAGIAAAAGGPKWFTTFGLMRYIIDDFLRDDCQDRFYIGSSVGSWQMAAACTANPGVALDRLKSAYINHIYSDKPDAEEISQACRQIIEHMISDQTDHIVNQSPHSLYIVASKALGYCNSDNKALLSLGLAGAAVSHSIRRSWLDKFMQRQVFTNGDSTPYNMSMDPLSTVLKTLREDNLIDSLRASGAIPLLMKPININREVGKYWDGGIVDYHMGYPYDRHDARVVLLPHFSPYILSGWFDKHLPYVRRASADFMADIVLIHPSKHYIASLPRKQISSLKDFEYYGTDQQSRISYWNTITEMSYRLAEEFHDLISKGNVQNILEPYEN